MSIRADVREWVLIVQDYSSKQTAAVACWEMFEPALVTVGGQNILQYRSATGEELWIRLPDGRRAQNLLPLIEQRAGRPALEQARTEALAAARAADTREVRELAAAKAAKKSGQDVAASSQVLVRRDRNCRDCSATLTGHTAAHVRSTRQ